jgi:hypothetical protein
VGQARKGLPHRHFYRERAPDFPAGLTAKRHLLVTFRLLYGYRLRLQIDP